VSAALDPLAIPGIDADSRNPAQLRADALVEVCRLALRTGELRTAEANRHSWQSRSPTTRWRERWVSAGWTAATGSVRRSCARLACDAKLLPVVLNGAGQVLDAGRSRRLATGPLRRALVVPDRGCIFRTCDPRHGGATATMSSRGRAAAALICPTWSCCADVITGSSTMVTGQCGSPPTACRSSSHQPCSANPNIPAATAITAEHRTRHDARPTSTSVQGRRPGHLQLRPMTEINRR
jgi:hypothetical protein